QKPLKKSCDCQYNPKFCVEKRGSFCNELYHSVLGLEYITDKLVFGSGTTLTVEPSNQEDSDPEVILIKSKPLEEGGSTGKAACLARNFYPKNINLDMLPAEVIYEQNTPIVTSEGTYNTIKVVNVTKASEVSCTAKFKGNFFTANATSSGDIKTEKTNMLSMAVLGLRVLLAKSIAFNTLMSIKLFLF
uniref:Immunoglobulin C1-set domain-containing protein n=1 Tax=Anser cygnoides TaxID=8845 RepID=A0A8B9EKJ0_ANSCY